jgi:hypothetical protein
MLRGCIRWIAQIGDVADEDYFSRKDEDQIATHACAEPEPSTSPEPLNSTSRFLSQADYDALSLISDEDERSIWTRNEPEEEELETDTSDEDPDVAPDTLSEFGLDGAEHPIHIPLTLTSTYRLLQRPRQAATRQAEA